MWVRKAFTIERPGFESCYNRAMARKADGLLGGKRLGQWPSGTLFCTNARFCNDYYRFFKMCIKDAPILGWVLKIVYNFRKCEVDSWSKFSIWCKNHCGPIPWFLVQNRRFGAQINVPIAEIADFGPKSHVLGPKSHILAQNRRFGAQKIGAVYYHSWTRIGLDF